MGNELLDEFLNNGKNNIVDNEENNTVDKEQAFIEGEKTRINNIEFNKFTAKDAYTLTNYVKPYEDNVSYVEKVYEEIIKKIKTAASQGKSSVTLEPNSELGKQMTIGTIYMLKAKGFTVEESSTQDMYNINGKNLGINISW